MHFTLFGSAGASPLPICQDAQKLKALNKFNRQVAKYAMEDGNQQ
jgi:hypothetical protein